MKRSSYFSIVLIVFFSLLITSCGFQLRGQSNISNYYPSLSLTSNNASSSAASNELIQSLKRALIINKVQISNNAVTTLNLVNETITQDIASVASNGKTAEHRILLSIQFKLTEHQRTTQSQRTVIAVQTINIERSYQADPNNIVGKNDERSLVLAEMRQQAIQQLLRQLEHQAATVSSSPLTTPATTSNLSQP